MNENPYQAPSAEITETDAPQSLASRWKRLAAAIIDSLILSLVTMPIMYFTGGWDLITQGQEPGLGYNLMLAAVGIVAFVLIQGKFLIERGQTLGKIVLSIRIVDMQGSMPTMNHYLKRYAVFFLPGQVPVAGQFFALINCLFIFGKAKRCIHDYAADTQVIDAK